MANNYTHFSQVISDLTKDESTWLKKRLEPVDDGDEKAIQAVMDEMELEDLDGAEYWPGFTYDFEKADTVFWVYSLDSGDLDHVAAIVHAFLKKFRPDDIWVMNWANFCSKPRIEEFDGGAMAVTAQGIEMMGTYAWTLQQIDAWEKRKK